MRQTLRPSLAVVTAALCALALGPAVAHAQLRIATYNTNNYSAGQTLPRSGMAAVLEALGDQARAGFARPLDILLLQEQSTLATTTDGFVDILNGIYGAGTYARGTLQGSTTGGGRPAVIYNTTSVQLVAESEASTASSAGGPRATLRHQFRPLGYDATADFYVYNSHFKAVDDAPSAGRRAIEVGEIRADSDSLGEGAHAIYVGDMNFYRSSESGFQAFLAAGAGQAFDPVNRIGSWNNSGSFIDVHTQSPVTTAQFDGQVIGGLDDRFDFQLVTGEVLNGRGFDIIDGSYWAFGNTGTHLLNGALSSGSATAFQNLLPGASLAEATAVIDAIMAASDHLPVVADYQLPAKLAVTAPALPATVLKGATVTGSLSVSNAAPVAVAVGADLLDYTVAGSGRISASAAGSRAALAAAATHGLSVDTSAAGSVSGTLTVTASSPQAADATFVQNYSLTVLDRAALTAAGSTAGEGGGGGGGGGGSTSSAFNGSFAFDGTSGNTIAFAYNGAALTGVTAGDLTKVGVTSTSSTGNSRGSNWPLGGTDGSDAFAGSFDAGKYFEFTLTPDAGKTLDLTSLEFGLGRSGTGPRQWQWRSSVDGYATAITTYATVSSGLTLADGVLTAPDSTTGWTGSVLDLSGGDFQGLSGITFRLFGFNAEGTAGTGGLQGPLSFAGSVVTPDPGGGGGGGDPVEIIGPGDSIVVANAAAEAGTQRAAAAIVSRTLTGHSGWSVSGLAAGTSIAAGASVSGIAAFDDTGLLNGTYTGLFTAAFEHADQSLPGAAAQDLGSLSWNLSTTVSGRTGSGTAGVGAGESFAGLGIESAAARGTRAAIEAGTAGTGRTVAMSFLAAPGDGFFASDVLTLTGTAGDAIVLSLTYDPASLGSLAAESLFVGWLDTRPGSPSENSWVNAILGNSANLVGLETAYLGSWADFQSAFSIAAPTAALGAWGVDADAGTVWAVVDHNSQFAAVPEPVGCFVAAAALAVAVVARSRRRPPPRREPVRAS
jgi:hypothetical protein